MSTYNKIVEKGWKILAYIIAAIFFCMLAFVFWQVFCRFVLKDSSGWTNEATMILFVWSVFLGGALAIHSGDQIAMSLVVRKLKAPAKQVFQLLTALLCELMYVLLTLSSYVCVVELGSTTTASLSLPLTVIYLPMMVCGIFMILFGIEDFVKPIRALKEHNALKGEMN